MSLRRIAILLAAAAMLVIAAAFTTPGVSLAASPVTVSCSNYRYGAIDRTLFPGIGHVKATGLPRLTSGYAPRCLVATSVAGSLQQTYARHGRWPSRVRVRGARWDAGWWRISQPRIVYSHGDPYGKVRARHGSQLVTFDTYS